MRQPEGDLLTGGMNALMVNELSILIPTRNDVCLAQVHEIQRLASKADGLRYEILVSDDASTDQEAVRQNALINDIEHCSLLLRRENAGRSANRNFLAGQARFEWLLFLDCNVKFPNDRFLANYLESDHADVVNGGLVPENDKSLEGSNLRYMYEKRIAHMHTAPKRSEKPYQSFRTANFMVRRDVMLRFPLDETISGYGYEDVLWGKTLCSNSISINHIDNPVIMTRFEENECFVRKVEEAMRTLHGLGGALEGFSPLLSAEAALQRCRLLKPFERIFKMNAKRIRENLAGPSPSIRLLNIYKLGYYTQLKDETYR